jgi:MoxR-like ATPase|tara:strand:- start:1498 stop:2490 length:993 start_codon:yes stop_codon:yes gene_type:complete
MNSSSESLGDTAAYLQKIRDRVGQIIVGQDVVVERTLIALLTSGHLLLEGMPGLAKTLLVNTISKALHLDFRRVQFTIDLLPSDILGSEILDEKSSDFRTHKGPIFTNLLLTDEINRAAPKVQGALLESMQERKVTLGNETYSLPTPFLVIATQNPIEQSGTFELPEAQLDRFMLCHRLGYPTPAEEEEILRRNLNLGVEKKGSGAVARTEFDLVTDDSVGTPQDLVDAMEATHKIHVSEVFLKHVVNIVERTRQHPDLELGCSPRAGISLLKASRARALIHGRNYAIPEDLFALAEDVCLHRIRLSYEALAEGKTPQGILQQILNDSIS